MKLQVSEKLAHVSTSGGRGESSVIVALSHVCKRLPPTRLVSSHDAGPPYGSRTAGCLRGRMALSGTITSLQHPAAGNFPTLCRLLSFLTGPFHTLIRGTCKSPCATSQWMLTGQFFGRMLRVLLATSSTPCSVESWCIGMATSSTPYSVEA